VPRSAWYGPANVSITVRFPLLAAMPALVTLHLAFAGVPAVQAQAQASPAAPRNPQALYRDACAACHGLDGRGAPQGAVGFDVPLPDFADCSFATREPDADWLAVAHQGGPIRGFDRRMPAFGEVLTDDELGRALVHIRGFCQDAAWPPGELNLPRALVTEKAYPEDEAVLTTTVGSGDAGVVTNQFLYEKRIGARSQYEVAVPVAFAESSPGTWERGLGDIAVAFKHTVWHSVDTGGIFSVAGEVVLPTGKESRGLGKGVTIVEPFAAYGQILPAGSFFHAQAGAELSTDRDTAEHEAFWRAAVGRTWEQGRFGRAWSPMVEILGAREIESGATAHWDIVPQVQVTLNQRQHVMINGGVRVPLNDRDSRDPQVIVYLLWDWFDGGLWDGW